MPPTHNIRDRYPECDKLGLKFVSHPAGEMAGYDEIEVEKALGSRFADFAGKVTNVFVCMHRDPRQPFTFDGTPRPAHYPADYHVEHKRGTEVHCFYARDVEDFLAGGK